jgi:hypothetical protein
MPATLPQTTVDLSNYPPAHGAAILALMTQGAAVVALPIGFGLAASAVLFTVPTLPNSPRVRVSRAYYEITVSFTGGASSAIGASSSNALYNTAGDIIGGASGDVAATLVSTGIPFKNGTTGAKLASSGLVVLSPGDTIIWNKITSAFTAGAGLLHVEMQLLPSS